MRWYFSILNIARRKRILPIANVSFERYFQINVTNKERSQNVSMLLKEHRVMLTYLTSFRIEKRSNYVIKENSNRYITITIHYVVLVCIGLTHYSVSDGYQFNIHRDNQLDSMII